MNSTKRALTSSEIDDLLFTLRSNHPETFVDDNVKVILRRQLEEIEIYPEGIPDLLKEIQRQFYTSFVHPGEMVGCVASTSIGEGQTQASLNSFHNSGALKLNLTSGVSRLNELLAATKNPKTPSLTIYFPSSLGAKRQDTLCIRQLCFSELESVIIQDIIKEYSIDYCPRQDWWYPFFKTFYSTEFEKCKFRLRLRLDQLGLWKCKKNLSYIVSRIESSVKGRESLYYAFSDDLSGIIDIWVYGDNLDNPEDILKLKSLDDFEQERVLEHVNQENKSIFFIRHVLIPQVLKTHISGIPGLQKCYIQEKEPTVLSSSLPKKEGLKGNVVPFEDEKELYVMTKGGTYKDLLKCSVVDHIRSSTNNMWEIYQYFGIEATVQFLINEFKKMNEGLSRRHLDVMVDWMCSSGTIVSVSRYGIEKEKVGPIAKASFEQPMEAFLKAAATGQREVIRGVSAAIATGKLARMGTGTFDLLMDVNKLATCQTEFEEDKKHKMAKFESYSMDIEEDWVQEKEIIEEEMMIEEEGF